MVPLRCLGLLTRSNQVLEKSGEGRAVRGGTLGENVNSRWDSRSVCIGQALLHSKQSHWVRSGGRHGEPKKEDFYFPAFLTASTAVC